jgi:adenylate cyclase
MKERKQKKMQKTLSVNELFSIEISKSERLRALLLIGLLALEAFLLIVIYLFYSEQYYTLFNTRIALYAILIFTVIIIIYESLVHYFLGKRILLFTKHRYVFAYLNVFSEISLLSVLFIFILEYTHQTVILQSPATLTYFIFIVLSTLRLDAKLSVFTGILAAFEFIAISIYYSSQFSNVPVDRFHPDLTGMQYLGQGVILIISGIAAGFVANLIKKKMIISWENVKEKNEIIDLFGQQISPQIATSILAKKDELSGARKMVCVMFLDIRDFTPFVESHTPEEVVTYLNKLFHFMIDIVQMHNGVINQFLGDGFMATFGAPVANGNISQNAVMAARQIIEKVKSENETGNIPKTRIGIGLHYGQAVIGNIGSSLRKQYSITGSVVIIASRIEQLNKTYNAQLTISEQVFNQLEPEKQVVFIPQQPVMVKGYNQTLSIYILDEENMKNFN